MGTRRALLSMDFVNDVVHPEGKFADHGYPEAARRRGVLENAAAALEAARTAGEPVIHVVVGFRPGYPELPAGSPVFADCAEHGKLAQDGWGAEIHGAVKPLPGEPVILKRRVSPFHGTDLDVLLRTLGVGRVALAGVATDLVVLSTARDAHDRDYGVEVLEDAAASANDALHEAAILLAARTATVTTTRRAFAL
jgi:nicotinamidase-related amidase